VQQKVMKTFLHPRQASVMSCVITLPFCLLSLSPCNISICCFGQGTHEGGRNVALLQRNVRGWMYGPPPSPLPFFFSLSVRRVASPPPPTSLAHSQRTRNPQCLPAKAPPRQESTTARPRRRTLHKRHPPSSAFRLQQDPPPPPPPPPPPTTRLRKEKAGIT